MRVYLDPEKVLDFHGAIRPQYREMSLGSGTRVRSVRGDDGTVYVETDDSRLDSRLSEFLVGLGVSLEHIPGKPISDGEPEKPREEEPEEWGTDGGQDFLDELPVAMLDLPPTVIRALEAADVSTLGKLKNLTEEDLKEISGIGAASARKIRSVYETFIEQA